MTTPFWPDHSPAFLTLRTAVRDFPGHPTIGLSGGADSLSLVAAARAEGRRVHAVIIDHGLQQGSREVAMVAARQACSLGASAEIRGVRVGSGNVEAQARTARYQALLAIAFRRNQPLWVAHTMDDQAETMLLAALRGNSGAMSPRTMREGVQLCRPFLECRRHHTQEACEELGLQPWQDPMNQDQDFLRVALRERFLPQLSTYLGRDSVPGLARAGSIAAADAAALEELAKRYLPAAGNSSVLLEIPEVANLPVALRYRILRRALLQRGLVPKHASVVAIDALITHWHGQGAVAVGGARVTRVGNQLMVRRW